MRVLIHATVIAIWLDTVCGYCQVGWSRVNRTQCYNLFLMPAAKSYADSLAFCRSHHARLPEVYSHQNQTFYIDVLRQFDQRYLKDSNINYLPIDMSHAPHVSVDAMGHVNHYVLDSMRACDPHSRQQCPFLQPNVEGCQPKECHQQTSRIVMCKKDETTSSEIARDEPSTSSCEDNWLHYDGHCYLLINRPLSIEVAQYACRYENASLVSIHSKHEEDFLRSQAAATFGPLSFYWTGLECEPECVWSDNSPYSYSNWPITGESLPHPFERHFVISQLQPSQWHLISIYAAEQHFAICKKRPTPRSRRHSKNY